MTKTFEDLSPLAQLTLLVFYEAGKGVVVSSDQARERCAAWVRQYGSLERAVTEVRQKLIAINKGDGD